MVSYPAPTPFPFLFFLRALGRLAESAAWWPTLVPHTRSSPTARGPTYRAAVLQLRTCAQQADTQNRGKWFERIHTDNFQGGKRFFGEIFGRRSGLVQVGCLTLILDTEDGEDGEGISPSS